MKYLLISILFLSLSAFGQQHLLLIGGGHRAPAILQTWINTSKMYPPTVMIITWASEIQAEVEVAIQNDFKQIGVTQFLSSQSITTENKAKFISDLKQATHIFFSGGDQTRIMIAVQDSDILNALKEAYWQRAIPVAGTSAGTAVQGTLMIQGDDKPLAPGLGFLPETITDQHFFKRHREPRLRAALSQAPKHFVGVGVDEDGAMIFHRDSKTHLFYGDVLGDKKVMYIDPEINGQRFEHILKSK